MKKTSLMFLILITIMIMPIEKSYGRKASIPIDIKLSMEGEPSAGGDLTLILYVRPLIEAPKIKISFGLPKGIEVISGEGSWEGEMAKNVENILKLKIRISEEKKYLIYGNVAIEFPDGTIMGDSRLLTIDLDKSEKPETPPTIRKNRQGESIIEFYEKRQ